MDLGFHCARLLPAASASNEGLEKQLYRRDQALSFEFQRRKGLWKWRWRRTTLQTPQLLSSRMVPAPPLRWLGTSNTDRLSDAAYSRYYNRTNGIQRDQPSLASNRNISRASGRVGVPLAFYRLRALGAFLRTGIAVRVHPCNASRSKAPVDFNASNTLEVGPAAHASTTGARHPSPALHSSGSLVESA
jgi:hypothetical protein